MSILPLSRSSLTMTSREIAELTGKQHAHVMRDIRAMVAELEVNPDLDFRCELETYIDAGGVPKKQYLLDRDTTLALVSGYNAVLRMRIIQRLSVLEQAALPPAAVPVAPVLPAEDPWTRDLRAYLGRQLAATAPALRPSLFVPMDTLLAEALGLDPAAVGLGERMRVGSRVRALGWCYFQPRRVPRKTGYRPGPVALVAVAPATGPALAAPTPPATQPPAPALVAPLSPEARAAIHRKAHDLSLTAFTHNCEILESWLRRCGDHADPAAAIERIHTLVLDHGQHVIVDLQLLHDLTSTARTMHRSAEIQMQALARLEAATGRQLHASP